VTSLDSLARELAITVANGGVWLSIGLALVLGALCLLVGTWVTRTVGLLERDAPAGETLGVGLGAGLIVLAALWAAMWSGGRSSFTPVAIGFAVAVGLALVRPARGPYAAGGRDLKATVGRDSPPPDGARKRRAYLVTIVAGGVFIVAIGLLYASTLAPSPRDGVQPVEFNDVAFYSVLGRDLATTGTETTLLTSGFAELPGLPIQTWYHWGELWLASAVIAIFGTAPLAARHLIVLPIALLAAAALTGTVVCRMTARGSLTAYVFGFLACLFLAPVPWLPGPFFSSWATGMIFGISLYGLAAVAVLLALYCLAVLGQRPATWALATFVGSVVALTLPAHIAVALLALVGVASAWAVAVSRSVRTTGRLPRVPAVWRRSLVASGILLLATAAWGLATGHGLGGGSAPAIVAPFNASWRESVAITMLGAGAFLAIVLAWFLVERDRPIQADLYFGTLALLVVGAIAWGARLGDFTTFYLFFAGIAVIATPVAAVAVRTAWERLRATRHFALALTLVILSAFQLELGAVKGAGRLIAVGPPGYDPIPASMLAAIRELPPDAKLAYSCRPLDEIGPGVPRLLSIDAHTGRRVVPMCFSAEILSTLIGALPSERTENLFFRSAPQRALYPDASARPSSAAVADFLKANGIRYIYVDAMHPNTLVADVLPVATEGDAQLWWVR
jgi:hypothetical protein